MLRRYLALYVTFFTPAPRRITLLARTAPLFIHNTAKRIRTRQVRSLRLQARRMLPHPARRSTSSSFPLLRMSCPQGQG